MPFKYVDLRSRLNANSHPAPNPDFRMPCRIWSGMKGGSRGYGKITMRSRYRHQYGPRKGERIVKRLLAHRVSKADSLGLRVWQMNHVCHLCNVPDCIEPTHLYSSTQRKNMRQMVAAGRHRNGHSK